MYIKHFYCLKGKWRNSSMECFKQKILFVVFSVLESFFMLNFSEFPVPCMKWLIFQPRAIVNTMSCVCLVASSHHIMDSRGGGIVCGAWAVCRGGHTCWCIASVINHLLLLRQILLTEEHVWIQLWPPWPAGRNSVPTQSSSSSSYVSSPSLFSSLLSHLRLEELSFYCLFILHSPYSSFSSYISLSSCLYIFQST